MWGKVVGATVGFVVGGPGGAILGAAAGSLLDRDSSDPEPSPAFPVEPAESLDEAARRRQREQRAASVAKTFLDYRRRAVASFEAEHGLRIQADAALRDATVAVPGALNEAVSKALAARHAEGASDLEARKARIADALRALGDQS